MKNFAITLFSLLISANILAQGNHSKDSISVQFITHDVSSFWEAFDKMEEKGESTFDNYILNGTLGLKGFMPWIQNSKALFKKVNSISNDYLLSRGVLTELIAHKEQINIIYASMKYWYPEAVFPPIYFVIGRFTSGGTANKDGIIIGTELYSNENPLPTLSKEADNTLDPADKIPTIIAHELIHYQQTIKGKETLLKQCIIEGSADFLGELISGENMNPNAQKYGNKHLEQLCKEFITRMDKNEYADWLYEISGKDERPYDLGYWIGYKITEAYYNKQLDKRLAIKNILTIENPEEFLKDSEFLEKFQQKRIPFLSKTPIIDGILDKELSGLRPMDFNFIWQFDNPVTDTAKVTYRMAYTPEYLYLYIETNVDSISYHRRGYLWGDGYKFLLGIPQKDALTDEYYELSFSPTLEKKYEWDKQRVMNYNFSQVKKTLSNQTKSQEKAQKGKSGFEALIAWSDIEPYHPWFMYKIGYNVYFAKGIESKSYGYITNGYAVVEDEGIWDEEIPKRNYNLLTFEQPTFDGTTIIRTQPKKQNLLSGKDIILRTASIGKKKSILIYVALKNNNNKTVFADTIYHSVGNNLKREDYALKIAALPEGKYFLEVRVDNTPRTYDLSILPSIPYKKLEEQITLNAHHLSKSVMNTLLFKLQELKFTNDNIKNYETGIGLIDQWKSVEEELNKFNKGKNPYQGITATHRLAFRSKYDSTLQPYTIKLPENYDATKAYPLLVFLHGSGQNEQGLLNQARSNGKFIELAPFARDKYRAFAEAYSQKDIIEAINDVKKNFNVDINKIIIGGFSMGGYGALRTFYEHPELYKGVAVFAGHPNLANEWLDGGHPNFLEDKYLKEFKNIPVFIYHGKMDAGLDVNLIEKMSQELSRNGAKVTKSIVPDLGHEYQNEETNELYFNWLNSIIEH